MYQIVLDTNVIASALLSKAGAAYKILMQLNRNHFEINLSVPLLLEYEYTLKTLQNNTAYKLFRPTIFYN